MSDVFPGKPIDVATRETFAFISSHLPHGSEILEIGCGDGEVALELARHGYHVVGLDSEQDRVAKAQARGVNAIVASWPEFHRRPVDAIAFTRSLHHINPLGRAVDKARELLKPRGVLLIEDFAFGETDNRSVQTFLEILRSKKAQKLIMPVAGQLVTDLLAATDPMTVWHGSHDQALHSIAAIIEAVSKRFTIRETDSVPYLYRYLIPVLPETEAAAAFLEGAFNEEAHLGRERSIVFMGRRIVADPE